MHYLYAAKKNAELRLVATFDSEQQLRSYIRWATLEDHGEQTGKFEQGSALAGAHRWEHRTTPPGNEELAQADPVHNPSPSML